MNVSTEPNTNRRKTAPKRRTFSVEGQLRAKLGNKGYASLLDALQRTARPSRRRGR